MKIFSNVFASVSCAALLLAGMVPQAKADAWNKKTIMTINEPLQVPKMVLQPGTYVLKLLDSPSDRHIVQIFDEKEKHLITTILAIPNYRLKVRGKTEFGFWETPAGQPHALRAWFYPGDNFGHEFAYEPKMSTQIATYSKETVPTTYATTDEELTTAKVEPKYEPEPETTTVAVVETETVRKTEPEVIAQVTPAPVAEPAPAPVVVEQADQAPTTLPQTASNYPLIALIGLLSLGAFTVLSVRAAKGTF